MRFLMMAVLLCAAIMMVGCSIGSVLSQNSDGGGNKPMTSVSHAGEI